MAVHVAVGARQRGQEPSLQSQVIPAPVRGMNTRQLLASNDPYTCVYSYNMVPAEYGMETRLGYREYTVPLESNLGDADGVRTLIPVQPADESLSGRLFAVTNQGIWDTQGPIVPFPVPEILFSTDQGPLAGYGNWAQFTTAAGDELVFYADGENGLFQYDIATNVWTAVLGITGVDPGDLVFVVAHKQRLWFVERYTTNAWYLEVGAITGPATKFTFGGKFKNGGDLVALYNWTIDGGDGLDDYLVAVSRGGDVLPYRGDDPAQAITWELVGTYYVGNIPAGRRCGLSAGTGELYLLSEFGLTTLSELLDETPTPLGESNPYNVLNVSSLIRQDMAKYIGLNGWELIENLSDGSLVISTPPRDGDVYLQYVMNYGVQGWGFWRGVPMLTAVTFEGSLACGTASSIVLRMDVTVDDVKYDDPTSGDPVEFSLLSNFFNLNTPGVFKSGKYIRPDFLSTQKPSINTKFLYDYNINGIVPPPQDLPSAPVLLGPIWDTAIWDSAVWGTGDIASPFSFTRGGWGRGRTVACAIRGFTNNRVVLASMDILHKVEGPF